MRYKIILVIFLFIPLIGCDQYTKVRAVQVLKGSDPIAFFNGVFTLTYHENSGAMLSSGANMPDTIRFLVFTVLVGVALVVGMVYVMYKPMNKPYVVVGLLILAGGFGNLYDRAFNDGRVVDFMLIQLGPLKTGVFNVADIAIMVGLLGFVLLSSNQPQSESE